VNFLERVFEARKEAGGWWFKDHRHQTTTVTVLGGEYCGCWIIRQQNGRKIFGYSTYMVPTIPSSGKWSKLYVYRVKQIELLEGDAPGLYILAEISGFGQDYLRQQLLKEPRRALGVVEATKALGSLSSHKERVQFAKRFLQTWSVKKSMPTWTKRIPWSMPDLLGIGMYGKYLPSDWQLNKVGAFNLARVAKQIKLSHTRSRALISKVLNSKHVLQHWHVVDILQQAHSLTLQREVVQTLRGQEVLEAFDSGQWIRLLNMGNRIMELSRALMRLQTTVSDTEAENKHRELGIALPEGVKQLVTKQDFLQEGESMQHCVAGYFQQTQAYYFHVGNSTLQVSREGSNLQHRGPANANPTKEELIVSKQICQMIRNSRKLVK
jgi:hypothetical protein